MKYYRLFVVIMLITSLILSPAIILNNTWNVDEQLISKKTSSISYTSHSPIVINADIDFISQGWPGYGNETHPYRIEDLEIMSDDVCIEISGTTVWFVINNCNLTSASGNPWASGNIGVYLSSLEKAVISNCTITKMSAPIYSEDVLDVTVTNNTIGIASWGGMQFSDSENITLFNNTGAVDIIRCTHVYVIENIGRVILRNSQECNITSCDFGSSSLALEGDSIGHFLHNISDNIANGLPVVYMRDMSDQVVNPSGYGQLILANCSKIDVLNGVALDLGYIWWITLLFSNSCTIQGNDMHGPAYSIILKYSQDTYINGNVFDGSSSGVHVSFSQNTTVTGNEFYDCSNGVELWFSDSSILTDNLAIGSEAAYRVASDNCLIIGNVAWDSVAYGIQVDGEWNTFRDNFVSNVSRGSIPYYESTGILVFGSNNYFENNTVEYVQDIGFRLEAANCTLIDNILRGSGLILNGYTYWEWMHNMSGNTLDGQPLMYLRNQIGGVLDAASFKQLIVANCSQMEIKNGVFVETLSVGFCDQMVIENNVVSNAAMGLRIQGLTNSLIIDNHAIDIIMVGFYMASLTNTNVVNNSALSCGERGFTINECDNCIVFNNIASDSMLGMEIGDCFNITLDSNIIYSNSDSGAYVWFSQDGLIVNNKIIYNDGFGIRLQGCSSFTLYDNSFGYNGEFNAYEDEIANQWDDGVDTGNAWSDYGGSGTYLIPGNAGSEDRYPTLLTLKPDIIPLDDVVYEDGSPPPLLNWTILATSADSFVIFFDGDVLESGKVNGSFVSSQISELDLGVYNVTLYVNNTSGAFAVDTVFITVVDTIAPTIIGPESEVTWTLDIGPYNVTWMAYDLNPKIYSVFVDGSLLTNGQWNSSGESITANLDHLAVGEYNVTLVVIDFAGNSAIHTVTVIVESQATNTTDTSTSTTTLTDVPISMVVIIATSGAIVIIIIAVFLFKRRP